MLTKFTNVTPLQENKKTFAWILLITLALVWGTSFILIKRGLVVYSPIEVGSFRIFVSGICCILLLIFNFSHIPFNKWKLAIISGLLGNLFPSLLFSMAGSYLESSVSGILNAFTPLATLVIGILFFMQKTSHRKIVGILIGLIGCIWLVFVNADGKFHVNQYAILPVIGTILYGINFNFFKRYLSDVNPLYFAILVLSIMTIPAGIIVLSTNFINKTITNSQSHIAISFIILLAVLSSVIGTILSNKLNQIASPLLTSSVTYLIPVVAIMWGVLDGEILGIVKCIGVLTIIIGILLVNTPGKRLSDKNIEIEKEGL